MSAIPYRTDIQGLRAVAVLAVILFHFNPTLLPGGFVGVDVFLVISGYLITSILLRRKARPGYGPWETLSYFYSSRVKRIAPAYFAMLVVVSLAAAVLFLPQDLVVYKTSLNKAAWFISNGYFANFGDYFAPASHEQPLLHTWSLAVEMQFYLLIPFAVLLLPIRVLQWLLVIFLLGLTAWAEYRLRVLGIQQATYFSLLARIPEFMVGALAASMLAPSSAARYQPWLGGVGLVLVLVAAWGQPHLGHFPGLPALLPVLGAALILCQPTQGWTLGLLGSRPMVWVGELSYSLYLWHWPVLALLRYYTGGQILDIPTSLLFLSLTLGLSLLSYYVVEIPLRAHRLQLRHTLGYALLALGVLGTSYSMAHINQALSPPSLPIQYQRYANPATICHGQIIGDCLKGDLNSEKEVLVLGDSHAAMLNLFFDQLGKDLGFKVRIITASSCVTIPGFDIQRIAEWARPACQAQIEQAQKYLPKAETVFLAAFWSWQLASGDFQKALERFLATQSRVGSKIYLLEQEPLLSQKPLRAIRFQALGVNTYTQTDPAYHQANAQLRAMAARYPGATSLGFESTGIFAQAPFTKGVLIYLDESHLNEEGAKRYATAALGVFQRIMK